MPITEPPFRLPGPVREWLWSAFAEVNIRTSRKLSRIPTTHETSLDEAVIMVKTALSLSQCVTGKTIVLTGAMVPYKFGSSDGLFNLGSALAFIQTLPAGVYIAMNGRYFDADRVHKNRVAGILRTYPSAT